MLKRLKRGAASLAFTAVLSCFLPGCGAGGGDDIASGGDASRAQWNQFDWDEAQWE